MLDRQIFRMIASSEFNFNALRQPVQQFENKLITKEIQWIQKSLPQQHQLTQIKLMKYYQYHQADRKQQSQNHQKLMMKDDY